MASLNEMNPMAKLGIMAGIIIGLAAAGWFVTYAPGNEANTAAQKALTDLKKSNDTLRHYKTDLPQLERQIETLKTQLKIQEGIVPSEKMVDQFIHVMQETAAAAGIEIRRYTAKPVVPQQYYTELPFEIDIDGPYYSVLDFFQKVSKLDRIIDIGTIAMATPEHSTDAKVKRKYAYAPGETVVASCTATTFFTHDATQTQPAPGARPGVPPGVPPKAPATTPGR
jgi:Tfp pilus assembly protein PilO